jgi:peptide/nickel transport system ATP-binding protein
VSTSATGPLLSVRDLRVAFTARGRRRAVEVLHGVDLDIEPGQTHGLVGDSGSGKTTIGRAVLGLVTPSSGSIRFDGREIGGLRGRARQSLSRDIQVVFQDPYTSLNPSLTVGDTLSEPLLGQGLTRRAARSRVAELVERVHLPADSLDRYPREFSGGQRQRIAIARAVVVRPRLIVCDEPVSALDLSTQRTVLDLLKEVQDASDVAYLFISHDLAVVRHVSDVVSVINGGDIVEHGDAAQVTERPRDPYTRRLLLSAPVADPAVQRARRAQYRAERGAA